LPTDHYIPSKNTFIEFLTHAIDCAQQQERIVLLGAQPTYPATGYGYIEYKKNKSFPCDVVSFHEKPSEAIAQQYVSSGTMLWNIGISCAQVSVMIQEFETNAPALFDAVIKYWHNQQPYNTAPSESIDYAVMEKSKNLCVLPINFVWCDVGNLNTFVSLCDHKKEIPHIVSVDSHNNVVTTNQGLVALIGIENMCVVQTEDVLLIAKRDETEKIKQVLEQLKQEQFDEYL
jgi:mannose-1-phosphate guanylyltransferase